ncbi:hypothetical protein GCM10007857_76790 [Bradyrhizobium iriomotense]|uniref:Uncharacterized protein n=1 Tax=Bradyrhizobium iriomotense TaxID=441950 RepID=A0ABQ6BB06_9BRAD|nr:hypothetical protein GCM10007857_76790 [Bradyrhizobium iriomotense]
MVGIKSRADFAMLSILLGADTSSQRAADGMTINDNNMNRDLISIPMAKTSAAMDLIARYLKWSTILRV